VNVRDHPAYLGQFKSGDGVVDTVHVCLLLGQWLNKAKPDGFPAAGAFATI
jgi:hypothetical protein